MYATNQRAAKMRFASPKIKTQYVNVHLDTKAIQYQKLVANWLMHARIALSRLYVKSHQPVTFANVHKATLDIQKQPDASQSVNVQTVIQIAPAAPDVKADVVLTNAMVYVDQT